MSVRFYPKWLGNNKPELECQGVVSGDFVRPPFEVRVDAAMEEWLAPAGSVPPSQLFTSTSRFLFQSQRLHSKIQTTSCLRGFECLHFKSRANDAPILSSYVRWWTARKIQPRFTDIESPITTFSLSLRLLRLAMTCPLPFVTLHKVGTYGEKTYIPRRMRRHPERNASHWFLFFGCSSRHQRWRNMLYSHP